MWRSRRLRPMASYDRLPALAADLVRRQVAVIVAITANPALAAKDATATIPIVFNVADDPVELGLVASLARPGGNATGVSFLFNDLVAKHLGLLRELLPRATRIGLLVNPQNANADTLTKNATAAASSTGTEIIVFRASDAGAIEDAFATLARQQADALMVGADGYFFRRRVQFATLAARHGLPTVFTTREFAEAGGLMSYGTSLPEAFRMTGLYTGRILKGAKPADLPVVQSTKFDFVINIPTARALGLDRAADATRACRRGDRIKSCLLRCSGPLMAQSSGSQDREFTSAFGGVAEMHGRTASAAFDANAE